MRPVLVITCVLATLAIGLPVASDEGPPVEPPKPDPTGFCLIKTLEHSGESGRISLQMQGGQLLSTGSKFIRVWDARSYRHVETVALKDQPGSPVFALKGRVLVGEASDERGRQGLSVLDRTTGRSRHQLPVPRILWWAVSPDGQRVVTTEEADGPLRLWDVETGKELWKLDVPKIKDRVAVCSAVAFSPDGSTIAVGLGSPLTVWLVDAANGKERRRLVCPQGVGLAEAECVVFSPDGRFVAAGSRSSLWDAVLWDTASTNTPPRALGYDPLGVGSLPRVPGETRLTGSGQLSFAPDGRTLGTLVGGSRIRLWEVATGGLRVEARLSLNTFAFLPGGELVTAADTERVCVWDWRAIPSKPPSGLDQDDAKLLWANLASGDATKAQRAMVALRAVPASAVGLFAAKLKPVPLVEREVIARWVTELGHEEFSTREAATERLAALAESVLPDLEAARAKPQSPEAVGRIDTLLKAIRAGPKLERVRVIRALEVLELIGTDDATAVVRSLAQGVPGIRETEDAKGALLRLESRRR